MRVAWEKIVVVLFSGAAWLMVLLAAPTWRTPCGARLACWPTPVRVDAATKADRADLDLRRE